MGKKFAHYVDYLPNDVLNFPAARQTIDQIREIGNDANHEVAFVEKDDARRAMQIIEYTLNAIYALPAS